MGYRTQHIDGMKFQIPEDIECIRQLWAAVMNRAIADLRGNGLADPDDKRRFAEQRAEMRAKAREYVERTDCAVGSFEWICRLMAIDSGRAREKLLEVRRHRRREVVAA